MTDLAIFNDIDNKTIYIYPKLKAAVNNSQGHTMKMRDLVTFSYYRNIDNQTGITFTDGVISNIGNVYHQNHKNLNRQQLIYIIVL